MLIYWIKGRPYRNMIRNVLNHLTWFVIYFIPAFVILLASRTRKRRTSLGIRLIRMGVAIKINWIIRNILLALISLPSRRARRAIWLLWRSCVIKWRRNHQISWKSQSKDYPIQSRPLSSKKCSTLKEISNKMDWGRSTKSSNDHHTPCYYF